MSSATGRFTLVSDFELRGDQARAIAELQAGLDRGDPWQVLLGVTGSGKTFTMAQVVSRVNRPTLVMVHNKTLAAQLYQEFRRFFPGNAVEYFVSYYDYYQPEAYMPATDTYSEKEATTNDEIDRMRLFLLFPLETIPLGLLSYLGQSIYLLSFSVDATSVYKEKDP